MNGPSKFFSARKIWLLLGMLAEFFTGARLLVVASFLQAFACSVRF